MLKTINEINSENPYDLVSTCLAAHVPPNDKNISSQDYLKSIVKDLFPQIIKDQLTNRVDIFIERNAFNINESKQFLISAKENGFTTTVHGNQFTKS